MGKIVSQQELVEIAAREKRAGRRVVFTNGCFDLLHPGHVRCLADARRLGDLLIVAVNSDRSVRGNKGTDRPLVPQQDRAEVLAALASVDYVAIFDEPTPRALISRVLPNILVKGADWALDQVAGREEVEAAGGRVVSIPLAAGIFHDESGRKNSQRRGPFTKCRGEASPLSMILPSVSETLASVSRHPALESVVSALRQGVSRERLAGLTETAKALHRRANHRRTSPSHRVLVATEAQAESLAASLQFFYSALAGQQATEVAVLPAVDALPWQDAAPHAEILETRAVTLWRYSTGMARVVVAPIAAARMRLADAAFYAQQAKSLAREDNISLDELVAHLRRVGYESHDMVEMPGQFTVRGGIVDVFPAEAERPVRLELFGDALESLREFDPNTQRSVRPIEHVTFPPLLENAAYAFHGGNGHLAGCGKISRGATPCWICAKTPS